ncbi:DUF397 domain-containing protein [Streptomyces sp. Vc74B-19]|uniref:DUF397 domain-containing protein n=1 Tax=unclassified Streptomyces TaxID=2593676 RepID=UPI001BFC8E30|nr:MULTISPECIES: DUF397 domain-containing protein [unclassified Streptomyces]MBT3165594.1 DUF397 domain-containing protein [Streptomyces sp. Vc74B-19]MDU0302680.1 DUF397 domain-containing protein [Streptomyces sp. PAL114]
MPTGPRGRSGPAPGGGARPEVRARDAKAPADGPVLRVGRDEWAAFVVFAAV